jgi:hypothetical protein
MRVTYRNVWSGALLVIIGEAANELMAELPS